MRVTITPTMNGAYTEFDDENVTRMSYQFDKEDGQLDGAQEMLYDIIDWIGLVGSRHDSARLQVRVVHGDKHECKGCNICKEV